MDAASGTPTLRAYDLANGQERWVFRTNGAADTRQGVGAGSVTSPVIDGDTVLFGVAVRAPAPDFTVTPTVCTPLIRQLARSAGTLGRHTDSFRPAVLDGMVYAMGGLQRAGRRD